VQPHVQAGRIRLLATGARQRTDAIREVPTIAETLPGFDLITWYGLFAPRRTPPAVVTRLHRELVAILTSAEIARSFAAQGIDPAHTTPQALEQIMRSETERWRKVIRVAGIRLE
jgi:tripartite-type tricarboxylate transporter receptor subunit TctC